MSTSPQNAQSNDPPIPLLFNGDAYQIYVAPSTHHVSVVSIELHRGNINTSPVEIRFFDLGPEARRAVVRQVQRRFPGLTVKI